MTDFISRIRRVNAAQNAEEANTRHAQPSVPKAQPSTKDGKPRSDTRPIVNQRTKTELPRPPPKQETQPLVLTTQSRSQPSKRAQPHLVTPPPKRTQPTATITRPAPLEVEVVVCDDFVN